MMAACQTRPLTPAEAVRQGRKLIAERRKARVTAHHVTKDVRRIG